MIELYAITSAPAPEADGLRAIENDGLAALCSVAAERQLSAEELWRREEVIESLMQDCDVLPVRYGTVVRDADEAARFLTSRRDELLQALERVRGAVELAVRVAGDERAVAGDGGGYMRVKTRLLEMHDTLSALARESKELAPGRGAYLVGREDVAAFVARVAALEEANEELSLLCTGPWPPYSFVGP
jgi:Gas vesicle synthesis protein GvpL/GvpF